MIVQVLFQAPPSLGVFALILLHLLNKLTGKVTPQATMVIAKTTLIPHAYAWRTPSSSAPENTWRNSVAPIPVTRTVLTLGTVMASLLTSWLTNPDCAAAINNVAPTDRQTVHNEYTQLGEQRDMKMTVF